jgi:hypothetical protein
MKKKSLSVYHLSSIENTLKKMPKYNPISDRAWRYW